MIEEAGGRPGTETVAGREGGEEAQTNHLVITGAAGEIAVTSPRGIRGPARDQDPEQGTKRLNPKPHPSKRNC